MNRNVFATALMHTMAILAGDRLFRTTLRRCDSVVKLAPI